MRTKGKWINDYGVVRCNGNIVADTNDCHNDLSEEESSDNAEFICKSVNLFDELVEALEGLQEAFVHIPSDIKGNKYRSGIIKHCENMRVALNKARNAVDKAKGEL